MKPLTRKRLSCWLIFYALSLTAILAAAGLLALLAIFDWRLGLLSLAPVALGFAVMSKMTGKAVWLMLCYASLCFPDNIWDRWMPPESP